MGVNKYSTAVGEIAKKSRLGCSVCLKKNSDTLTIHSSSNKLCYERINLKNNIINTKYNECEKSKIIPVIKPKVNECYCKHMEEKKNESFQRLICSKRFKTNNDISIDEDWLNEIKDFRRENWFDCHSDSIIDLVCSKNVKPLYIFNKHILDCNPINDSILLNHIECNKLKTDKTYNNIYLDSSTKLKHVNVNKKIIEEKSDGKKKNYIPHKVYKPWIPPSNNY